MARNTHKAVGQLTHARPVKDQAEADFRQRVGMGDESRTLAHDEQFNPSDLGMSKEDVKRLEERGTIKRLEGADDKDADVMNEGIATGKGGVTSGPTEGVEFVGNKTEGSGAVGQGQKSDAPAGINPKK